MVSQLLASVTQAGSSGNSPPSASARLVIQRDDAGARDSVNMGLEPLIETGLPVSVSVLFARPSYRETVEMLKRHPDVAAGSEALWQNHPDISLIEQEYVRASVARHSLSDASRAAIIGPRRIAI